MTNFLLRHRRDRTTYRVDEYIPKEAPHYLDVIRCRTNNGQGAYVMVTDDFEEFWEIIVVELTLGEVLGLHG